MGWTVWSLIPGGGEIFCIEKGFLGLLHNAYWIFPGGKAAGVLLTTHPNLLLRLKKRAIILPPTPLGVINGLLQVGLDRFMWKLRYTVIKGRFNIDK